MANLKLISYNGRYPNLCSGRLVIAVNDIERDLGCVLTSGGSVWFDKEWCEHVEDGEWRVGTLPPDLERYRDGINRLVNENVQHGCCGGCV